MDAITYFVCLNLFCPKRNKDAFPVMMFHSNMWKESNIFCFNRHGVINHIEIALMDETRVHFVNKSCKLYDSRVWTISNASQICQSCQSLNGDVSIIGDSSSDLPVDSPLVQVHRCAQVRYSMRLMTVDYQRIDQHVTCTGNSSHWIKSRLTVDYTDD